jgi:hypothetical protein
VPVARSFAGAFAAVAALAGCGSSHRPQTVSQPTGTAALVNAHTYHVTLEGSNVVPAGASTASASAVIALRKYSPTICWTFERLKGFTKPSVVQIHKGAAGTTGPAVMPGLRFALEGCAVSSTSITTAIAASPAQYYIDIRDARHPTGAARGQL